MALLLLSVNRQHSVKIKSVILSSPENKEMFSLKGNSYPYGNRVIYVPFDLEVRFAYTTVPKKHEISMKNKAIILEYFEEQF